MDGQLNRVTLDEASFVRYFTDDGKVHFINKKWIKAIGRRTNGNTMIAVGDDYHETINVEIPFLEFLDKFSA
jgi:hypothetical protein